MANSLENVSRNLAQNLLALRKKRGMSQGALAKLAEIPRSTVAHLESGSGNPSLTNLSRISAALQVNLEELLSRPRSQCQLIHSKDVPVLKRSQGAALLYKLLPDPIPGMEIDRMELEKGGRMGGVPHVTGTKEYLTCIQGEVTVSLQGERYRVREGDVFAFPGDQPHSYHNTGSRTAICLSVVALALPGV